MTLADISVFRLQGILVMISAPLPINDIRGIQFEQVAGILRVTEQHQRYAAARISVIHCRLAFMFCNLFPPLRLPIP